MIWKTFILFEGSFIFVKTLSLKCVIIPQNVPEDLEILPPEPGN